MLLQRFVQFVRVRRMMLVVVDLHGARIDVRLERVECVRQVGELERMRHCSPLVVRAVHAGTEWERAHPAAGGRARAAGACKARADAAAGGGMQNGAPACGRSAVLALPCW